ncbi:hypothetical protein AXG93_3912s1030 [Marchantia polymorpha subsp. ruderalis]|uniref:Uncharacterized protein n=1 Tax=Marchantia polymorpha subsp. ruderalis TaxID=1480154 RepID=A0A176VYE8_MARPO|nr:hypothetical protein AXG93_3912s1030 [Marchantia polymorpha subsp. ruderalis]
MRAKEKTYALLFKKPRSGKNGYQTTGDMGLLTKVEQKQFLFLREAGDEDETLGGKEVNIEKDDIKLALPLARVDKLEDEVEERA